MKKEETIKLLEEVVDFLTMQIGIGDRYGDLGHVTGGVLSHGLLNNDPHCYSVNDDGIKKESTLNPEDYVQVEYVWHELEHIIKKGTDMKFVERLNCLIDELKRD